MSRTPGSARLSESTTHRNRSNHEDRVPAEACPEDTSVESLVRFTHRILERNNREMSSSKVVRIVRQWKHQVEPKGLSFGHYLVTALAPPKPSTPKRAWPQDQVSTVDRRAALALMLQRPTYADPTGETATRRANPHVTKLPKSHPQWREPGVNLS